MNSIRKMLPIKDLGIEGYRIPKDDPRVEHMGRRYKNSYLGKKSRAFPFEEIVKSHMVVTSVDPEAKTKSYQDTPSPCTYKVLEPEKKYFYKIYRRERKTEISEWFEQ